MLGRARWRNRHPAVEPNEPAGNDRARPAGRGNPTRSRNYAGVRTTATEPHPCTKSIGFSEVPAPEQLESVPRAVAVREEQIMDMEMTPQLGPVGGPPYLDEAG